MSRLIAARAAVALGLTVGTAAGFTVLASDASAVPGPPPTLSKTTIGVGESFTVSGSGCVNSHLPYNTPFVSVEGGAFIGQTRASETGTWSLTMDMGAQLGPGTYTVSAVCNPSQSETIVYADATVTVVGAPMSPPPPQVPPAPTGPAVARPTAPRTTAPATKTPATTTSSLPPTATGSTWPTPAASPSSGLAPTPVAGCQDCATIDRGEPLVAGQSLTLSYAGFQPGEAITLVMHSTPVDLGTFTADASGVIRANVTIPASADAGKHTLILSGAVTGDQVVELRLAALQHAAAAASDGRDLTLPLALGGSVLVLLLVAGGFVVHRRRIAGRAQETATPIAAPTA